MEGHSYPRLSVDPEVFQRYADYRAHVVYARDVNNGPSDQWSSEQLRKAEEHARETFHSMELSGQPHISAWRTAYSQFGSKPSKYQCSAEALLRRALRGEVPRVNRLVDIYNSVSISAVLPVGGEDIRRMVGDPRLCFARGGEPFECSERGVEVVTTAYPGEVVWIDDKGVTCRRWNWRQCSRTALTHDSSEVCFVLDALDPFDDLQLRNATEMLIDLLWQNAPDCDVEVSILSPATFPIQPFQ